jgi:hypothetical protein
MLDFPKSLALSLYSAALAGPALASLTPFSLIEVSESLLRAYNAQDASAFHELLAPPLQARYPVEAVALLLARCRGLTHEIDRFSTPSWGGRHYGFFGVYAEVSVWEMVLEIDENQKIVHWMITDDVTSKEQQCAVTRDG